MLARGAGQLSVGIDGDGMADGLQHREVGRRVRVRVAGAQVDAALVGDLVHGDGLVRAVGVELGLAGVTPLLVERGAGGDEVLDAEVLTDRADDLLG